CLDLLRWGVAVSPDPASTSSPGDSSSTRAVSFLRPCRPSRAPPLARGHRTWGGGTFLSNPEGSPSAVRGLLAIRAILVALFGPSDPGTRRLRSGGANAISRCRIAGRVAGERRILLANSIYHLTNDGAVAALAGQIIVLQAVFGGFGPAEVALLGGTTLVITAICQILFALMSDRREPSR